MRVLEKLMESAYYEKEIQLSTDFKLSNLSFNFVFFHNIFFLHSFILLFLGFSPAQCGPWA